MKKNNFHLRGGFFTCAILLIVCINASAQIRTPLKRITYQNETVELGAGGTLTLIGAPEGSVTIEGWSKNQVEISAETEVQAESESDLAILASVNRFIVDESYGHLRIFAVGTHDRSYTKKLGKKLPKNLVGKSFKIDFKIKVPNFLDLELNIGRGDFKLLKVEGSISVNSVEGNGDIEANGGTINAVFGKGDVKAKFNARSWRGRHVDIQVIKGNLAALFPANFHADIDASVLREGKIENEILSLKPRPRTKFTEKQMSATSGNGGVVFSFTVGEGALKLALM